MKIKHAVSQSYPSFSGTHGEVVWLKEKFGPSQSEDFHRYRHFKWVGTIGKQNGDLASHAREYFRHEVFLSLPETPTLVQDKEMISETRSVSLVAALATFEELWSPRIVTKVNNYDVRVAKVRGEYVWHSHLDTDEFFLVLEGELTIGLRDATGESSVHLGVGEVFTVPRAMEHRPMSAEGASIMMFEITGTLTTGDYAGDIPDHIDSTVGQRL
jgi:mannose-6-phosphate isomerase-like protein (cupin superfamily)